jgi:hypothetical protein
MVEYTIHAATVNGVLPLRQYALWINLPGMTFYGAIYWPSPETCLDDEFDVPNLAADQELCCAIAAGRWGLHPDGWGNHDPLPLRWLLRKRRLPEVSYDEGPVDPEWEAQHRRRPVENPTKPAKRKPRPEPPPAWHWVPQVPAEWERARSGTIELTCDVCGQAFGRHLVYGPGQREAMAAGLRALGAQFGWIHIDGRDRCPTCSPVAPKNVGNGAGERQGDKKYTNGG